MMRWLLYALLAMLAVAITVLVVAPARWAASALESASHGRLQLAETRGSLWDGSGVLVLAAGSGADASRASLPERLAWRLSPWALLTGQVDLAITHPSALAAPLQLRAPWLGSAPVTIAPATLRLPASLLSGLGAPWNTLRPGGTLVLSWAPLTLVNGTMTGAITMDWQFATSALTPVNPMGSYRFSTDGKWPGTTLQLQTLSGPLEMNGTGTIDPSGAFRFQGRAQAKPGTDPAVKAQLAGLISLIGRRDGEGALLNIGSTPQ